MRIAAATLIVAAALLAGCEGGPFGFPVHEPVPSDSDTLAGALRPAVEPADPAPVGRSVVHLTAYPLLVPVGTASRNERFWKHADEQVVDALTYDVLYRNGIRVGLAPLEDLPYFAEILSRGPARSGPVVLVTAGVKAAQIPMKRNVPGQIVCNFDARNILTVRSFDESDNVFCLEFQPAPRRSGDVRLALVPMIRSLRRRLVAAGDLETAEIDYISPERYYDVNLRVEIPSNSFLIVAPSPEASSPMSLGHAFLIHDGEAERLESVLLFIPQIMSRPLQGPGREPATLPAVESIGQASSR